MNDDEARRVLEEELLPGERLLWSGKPASGIRITWSDLPAIPIGLLIFGVGLVFMFMSAEKTSMGMGVRIFAVLPVLAGLHAMGGTFLLDAWKRRRTVYGVTTDRVIVVRQFPTRRAKSQYLGVLSNLAMDRRKDSSGSIVFGPWGQDESPWKLRFSSYIPTPTLRFDQLADCADVYEVIQRSRQELMSNS